LFGQSFGELELLVGLDEEMVAVPRFVGGLSEVIDFVDLHVLKFL
jgi:hypothetical protein